MICPFRASVVDHPSSVNRSRHGRARPALQEEAGNNSFPRSWSRHFQQATRRLRLNLEAAGPSTTRKTRKGDKD
jgi:hypothetical protein